MKKNTTHNLTVAAMLSAVAFILMFIEFPLSAFGRQPRIDHLGV